jgi:hypothetical protein
MFLQWWRQSYSVGILIMTVAVFFLIWYVFAGLYVVMSQQDRQYSTFNVTLRCVRESLLQWKINDYYIFLCVRVCVWLRGRLGVFECVRTCSLTYPACKALAPYCVVICDLSGSTVFSTLSHKWHDLFKNGAECKMCILIFSAFVLNFSYSENNSARYSKCT